MFVYWMERHNWKQEEGEKRMKKRRKNKEM